MSEASPKLFISGSSADAAGARHLASALEREGIEALSADSLDAGRRSSEGIVDLIYAADGVVFLIEAKSKPSSSTSREWESALEASWEQPEKRLIPVVAEGAAPPAFLQSYDSCVLPADRSPDTWNRIAREIAGTLRRGVDRHTESRSREAAWGKWREGLRTLEAAVKPLADAERGSK